jgi:hypothetical protein
MVGMLLQIEEISGAEGYPWPLHAAMTGPLVVGDIKCHLRTSGP